MDRHHPRREAIGQILGTGSQTVHLLASSPISVEHFFFFSLFLSFSHQIGANVLPLKSGATKLQLPKVSNPVLAQSLSVPTWTLVDRVRM